MSKNVVVCCDGTSNDATSDVTNVLRVYRTLQRDGEQICHYDGGVGTLVDPTKISRWRKFVRRKIDMAIGYSLHDNFCKAYRFLARHYEPGDRIYLFGFSRGAYLVRALAGALYRQHLVRPELESLTEYAWAAYSNEMDDLNERALFRANARFAKFFSVGEVPIHFLGVFDTVSSFGWIWNYRTLPNTAHNPAVKHVRHAVSIDECRACFRTNLFHPKDPNQHESCVEVWFPGVHADVGGGYPEEESGLAKISLQWMLHEAEAKELRLDRTIAESLLGAEKGQSRPDALAPLHESLIGYWKFLELLPRRTWSVSADAMRWRLPNWGSRRVPPPGVLPCVHQSAIDRKQAMPDAYKPKILDAPFTTQPWTSWR